ncbi:hypothetical protein LTR48_002826 [Friedmanniomyces endolithicus]|uniref:Uncharacterized protein n=1 Tax=Rachicladosporium monterosium TaxID=1507873 RepID=A0ABR0LA44_9PEZI|nr:hypothetical protein LTR29_004924 [Friedmanniomyces endolithicus]KAK1093178.1 hypothetical protein LTR48_002826 [Friedmanniomyces endolithicus]KAK5145758.1 hypothetical protein LTR32_002532 [Rachicladosporium monterosium]
MSIPMQIDPPTTRPRKRTFSHRSATDSGSDSDSPHPATQPNDSLDTSPKRSRNSQGYAIHRRGAIHYNAQALLNNLAYTRLYVTANFQNYSASSSPVVVCLVAGWRSGVYRMLCRVLPRLYGHAPSLQALAVVVSSGMEDPSAVDPSLHRIVPRVTLDDLREDVVADLASFRESLGGPEEVIVLIEPSTGKCLWSSDQIDHSLMNSQDDCDDGATTALLDDALGAGILMHLPRSEHSKADAMEM